MTLTWTPARVTRLLVAGVCALAAAHASVAFAEHGLGHGRLFGLVPLFDMDVPRNVPTWFSYSVLLICALLCGLAGASEVRAARARTWRMLGGIALLLSFGEALGLRVVIDMLRSSPHPWMLALGGVVGVALLVLFGRAAAQLGQARRHLVLAAGLYLGSALGLEFGRWALDQVAAGGAATAALVGLGESLGLLGVVVALHGVSVQLAARAPELALSLGGEALTSASRYE